MQICSLLTRCQCKVSDTPVTVRPVGLLLDFFPLYLDRALLRGGHVVLLAILTLWDFLAASVVMSLFTTLETSMLFVYDQPLTFETTQRIRYEHANFHLVQPDFNICW